MKGCFNTSFCTAQGADLGSVFQFCLCAPLEVQARVFLERRMPIVSNCLGLLNVNRLNGEQMLLGYLIKWIVNTLILVTFQLRVFYQNKYYSARIMHMNKASRFTMECETACHWCIWLWWPVLSASYPGSHWMRFTFCIRAPGQDLMKMCTF